jgi:hypothetical protein
MCAWDGKFSEVLVDHDTGKVAKTEAITGGDNLADAKKQIRPAPGRKKSLKSAVDQAQQASAGTFQPAETMTGTTWYYSKGNCEVS